MTPLQRHLRNYAKRVKNAQPKVDQEIRNVLNRNKLFLAELNRSQLVDGKDRNGNDIGARLPYRSTVYAAFKNQLNPLPGFGNPDLRLTGDYWESITAKIEANSFTMVATDPKADDLAIYEGIGIAPENLPEISNLIRTHARVKI